MTVITLDLDELADEWQELLDEADELEGHDNTQDDEAAAEIRESDCEKYKDLCSELGISPAEPDTLRWYDREHGETFIREDTFEDYAREMAEDVCAVNLSEWPATCIDWSKAADELRMDYTTITYDGEDYLTR